MRSPKFLLSATLITIFSLVYVWQQTEIFRLAYEGEKSLKLYEDLVDKNTILRYNVQKNASLIHIGNKVFAVADFQMPDTYRLVRLAYSGQGLIISKQLHKRENIVSGLFGIKRQAQAETIKPSGLQRVNGKTSSSP